jgi:hypothetical protein
VIHAAVVSVGCDCGDPSGWIGRDRRATLVGALARDPLTVGNTDQGERAGAALAERYSSWYELGSERSRPLATRSCTCLRMALLDWRCLQILEFSARQ